MIKELIKLANNLDKGGHRKEADHLDSVINKIAVWGVGSVGEVAAAGGASNEEPTQEWNIDSSPLAEHPMFEQLVAKIRTTTFISGWPLDDAEHLPDDRSAQVRDSASLMELGRFIVSMQPRIRVVSDHNNPSNQRSILRAIEAAGKPANRVTGYQARKAYSLVRSGGQAYEVQENLVGSVPAQ